MKKTKTLILFSFLIPAALHASADNNVVEALEKRYADISVISASFTQETLNKTLNQKDISHGRLFLKKPGKIRLDYANPQGDEMISDGITLWIYQADLSQAIETSMEESATSLALNFLVGAGDIKRDFSIEVLKKTNGHILTLIPKKEEPAIKKLLLEINKEFIIEKMTVFDNFNTETTVSLKDVNVNPEIEDSLFVFKAKDGVKIIKP